MKANHIITFICAVLGVYAASRFSLPRTPQPEKQIVVSQSASPVPLPNQTAIVRNGNETLRVAGSASLVPSQPAPMSSSHH